MIENAAAMGARFLEGLRRINNRFIVDVRGRGLLMAVEFSPEAGGARRYTEALKQRGILCKETHEHIIRFAPPLIIDTETVDWAVESITEVLEE
jgi:ornithine--oxo-acid transaminase